METHGIKRLSCKPLERPGLVHGFLGRTGGVSPASFESLNLDFRTDAEENVLKNRERIERLFSLPAGRLITLNQVHGDRVFVASDNIGAANPPEADAVVTSLADTPIGVLTADCLPALLYDPVKKAVGAAHAGWRGALLRVAGKAVKAMAESFGSRPKDVIACLGPRIRPCCYEVSDDVVREFEKACGDAAPGFFEFAGGSPRLDLAKAVSRSLVEEGLLEKNICQDAPCTACDGKDFFSYRKEKGVTGRQLSFIMLRG